MPKGCMTFRITASDKHPVRVSMRTNPVAFHSNCVFVSLAFRARHGRLRVSALCLNGARSIAHHPMAVGRRRVRGKTQRGEG